jgi:hypothetical protein
VTRRATQPRRRMTPIPPDKGGPELARLIEEALDEQPSRRPSVADFGRRLQEIERGRDPRQAFTEADFGDPESVRTDTPESRAGRDKGAAGRRTVEPTTLRQVEIDIVPPVRTGDSGDGAKGGVLPPGAGLWAGVAAVIVLLLAAGAVFLVRAGDEPTTAATRAAPAGGVVDAVPDRVPTPVVSVTVSASGEIAFTWTYEPVLTGDYFRVRFLNDPNADDQTVREPRLTIPATDPRPCIEVTLFRTTGRGSAQPGRVCAP